MRILFMHNNFPGQYRRIMRYIKDNKPDVSMLAATLEDNKQKFPVRRVNYRPHRDATKGIHPSLIATERAVINGQAAYKSLMEVKRKGYRPDIILSHSGWGNGMFMKDLFPDAKLLSYYEWYYHSVDSDGTFLRDDEYDANGQLRIRMKNTPILQDLAAMDWGQSPTVFQHSKFPSIFQDRISILHDGVDTDYFMPDPDAKLTIGDVTLSAENEVISYVARGMEPYRGFPQFMEAVSKLQKIRPNLHVVILGNDRVAYGSARPDGKTYKEWALEEFEFDHKRLHFMGLQPLDVMRTLLQLTSAHVYLTVPFVLSWSMLEAMCTGALIVASDTDPVKELITDGESGVMVPFFDVDAQVEKICHILDNKADYQPIRDRARQVILERYAVKDLLPQFWQLIKTVANGSQK